MIYDYNGYIYYTIDHHSRICTSLVTTVTVNYIITIPVVEINSYSSVQVFHSSLKVESISLHSLNVCSVGKEKLGGGISCREFEL